MKKLIFTLLMASVFCFMNLHATQTVVAPGDATLSTALKVAAAGDTLILKNDSVYDEYDSLIISKKVTIMAARLRKLPGLEKMPKLTNMGKIDPFFKLYNNADLTIIGINIDNNGGMDVIRTADRDSTDGVFMISIDRCRIHNTTFAEKDKAGLIGYPGDKMVMKYKKNLKKFYITNSIVYDLGARSAYFKNWTGEGDVKIENCTFYNIGQQSFYVKWLDENTSTPTAKDKLNFMYNHNTNYLLSSNGKYPKEIMGNATGQTTAGATLHLVAFTAKIKNSIFVKQVSTNGATLIGDPTSMGTGTTQVINDISVTKNIFVGTAMQTTGGNGLSITESSATEPAFTDSLNRNFTIGTASVLTLADDGKTLGALYWDPGFKDVDVVTNAKLSGIKIGEDALGKFSAATTSYAIELAIGTTAAPTVSAVADDDLANVAITQCTALPGKATVVVTAEDGTTKKTYEINFTVAKELSKNADLAGIKYGDSDVPGFAAGTLEYSIGLSEDVIDLPTVTVTKADARSTVKITQAVDLPGDATIEVTSEDGTVKKTYVIHYVISNAINSLEAELGLKVYPNPLTSESKIEFNLKNSANVEVSIFNLNGQLVSSVLKNSLNSGSYSLKLDARGYTSGVYILRTAVNNIPVYMKLVKK